jgi:membrane fusion protein (multidrug efflux system)
VNRKLISIFAILALLAASAMLLGCGGSGEAQASSDGSQKSDAEPAKNSPDDTEGKEDEDADDKAEGEDEEKKEEAVPVEVAELDLGPIESVLRFSSNLEAEEQVKVFSEAKRLVKELLVEEGDRVRRGQLLLRLQDDEQRSNLAKTESQLAKAEREYERQQRLFAQELVSEQQYNDATYDFNQRKIALADVQRELGYTEVRAPISGTISGRLVNLGDQVQIGQHLFDIVDFDSIVARIYVPEEHLDALRKGLAARISSQVADGRSYTGEVDRIAPIVDPKSGTVKVTVDVGAQAGLRPGMYVDVELVMATRDDAVLLPKRALVYDNDQMFVYRLNGEERVERIYVEAALSDKYNIEPRSGLDAGDRVVVAGQAGLKDGALVSIPAEEARRDEDADGSLEAADQTEPTVERASL